MRVQSTNWDSAIKCNWILLGISPKDVRLLHAGRQTVAKVRDRNENMRGVLIISLPLPLPGQPNVSVVEI